MIKLKIEVLYLDQKLKEISKIFGLDRKYSIEKLYSKKNICLFSWIKALMEGQLTMAYVRTKSSWSYSTSSPQLKDEV